LFKKTACKQKVVFHTPAADDERPMAATIDETVASGFKLGWLVGHLYHDTRSLAARPTTAPPAQLPPRLPDPSGLPGNGYAKRVRTWSS